MTAGTRDHLSPGADDAHAAHRSSLHLRSLPEPKCGVHLRVFPLPSLQSTLSFDIVLDWDVFFCHLVCLPGTDGEAVAWEFVFMGIFGAIAILLALFHFVMTRIFAVLYVCLSIGNGGVFVLTMLFVFYPVSAHVRGLLSFDDIVAASVVGSATIAVLQLNALLRGP